MMPEVTQLKSKDSKSCPKSRRCSKKSVAEDPHPHQDSYQWERQALRSTWAVLTFLDFTLTRDTLGWTTPGHLFTV